MGERIGPEVDDGWNEYREQEHLRSLQFEQARADSGKSPTLSIRHFLREHGVVSFAVALALMGLVAIPNIGGWGNINLKEGLASMQSRIQPEQALGSFAIQHSEALPVYIQRSTGDLLSWPDPNMDNKSALQIYQELGLQLRRGESLLGKNIIVIGKKGHLVTSMPIPTTKEAQEKYKKYKNKIILGKFKWDVSREGYAVSPLLEEEKSSVQFFLLIDPYTYGSIPKDQALDSPNKYPVNEEGKVGVFEPAWIALAVGRPNGKIEYDKGVLTSSPELHRILQRLLASAFSAPTPIP